MRRRGGFRTCRGQSERFVEAKRVFLLPRLELAVSRLLLPHLAASLRFQKCRKRKDHSLKKFSGFRLARQDTQCLFSTTPVNKSSPQALKTHAFLGVPGNSSRAAQEASETAPRGQAPQGPPRPPRGPEEAPKRPPRGPLHVNNNTSINHQLKPVIDQLAQGCRKKESNQDSKGLIVT